MASAMVMTLEVDVVIANALSKREEKIDRQPRVADCRRLADDRQATSNHAADCEA